MKERVKTHSQNAPMVKRQSNLDGRDPRAQINGAHWILEPPHLSTFKRRGWGGSRIGGAYLRWLRSEHPDQRRTLDYGAPPPFYL
jgi:hypothetical protein